MCIRIICFHDDMRRLRSHLYVTARGFKVVKTNISFHFQKVENCSDVDHDFDFCVFPFVNIVTPIPLFLQFLLIKSTVQIQCEEV